MIQHIWTIPCRMSLTDRETNSVTLIGVIEEVGLPELPLELHDQRKLVPAFLEVVTLWSREIRDQAEVGYGRSRLISPENIELFSFDYQVDLTATPRSRTIGRVFGFRPMPQGQCTLRTDRRATPNDEWETVSLIPIEITHVPAGFLQPDRANGQG
jgi:hypothetical protein